MPVLPVPHPSSSPHSPLLDANTAKLAGHALVSSRLDYANLILYGMLSCLIFDARSAAAPATMLVSHSSETRQVCQVLLHLKIGTSIAPNSPEYNRQDVGRPRA